MNEPIRLPITIALVDDHILLRDALASVINLFDDCRVTILADNGKSLLSKMAEGILPDLVILDVNMPEMDGYATAAWLQRQYPSVRLLVLTMYDSELAMIRLLQLGVRGFLQKDIHPAELRQAIASTMETGYYYSGHSATKLVSLLKNVEAKSPHASTILLSDNELLFLTLAATEMTYKEIAKQMTISPHTVDNYRNSLFLKLDVKSRVGLVLFAIKNGVITNTF